MDKALKEKSAFVDLTKIELNLTEVSVLFGVSRQTIWKWREEKGMPYENNRGFKKDFARFDYQDLVEWSMREKRPMVGRSKLRKLWKQEGMEEKLLAEVKAQKAAMRAKGV